MSDQQNVWNLEVMIRMGFGLSNTFCSNFEGSSIVAANVISSDKLKGLEVDNNDHRYAAPSFATGAMKLASNRDPAFVRSWRLEFDCETTKSPFWSYSAEVHDLMREVLRENGIDAT